MNTNELATILNTEQLQGVTTTEGPLLILAGAGSGKTRVLTHRVAYLIEQGVEPWQIMAITFTNKAAAEMRERVNTIVGHGAEQVWVATFHSSCVRILRRFADRIGYSNNFSIYDADDSKSLMKEVCKYLNIDTKKIKEKRILSVISSAKDEMINEEEFASKYQDDFMMRPYISAYREYQSRLRSNNAFDFDDLLLKTVELLKQDPEVLSFYQKRFRYVMVDEYQDTNTVQFEFVRLLADGHKNLCVVGDDDQSIYKFRGANIHNILNFEQHFNDFDPTVIRLEQNYRSTKRILFAANAVIANNEGRKEKTLWTENEEGEKIRIRQFDNAYEEGEFIAMDIKSQVRRGEFSYKDCAVLYRTNAQSRILEEKCLGENIPYRIVGGVNFYSRKEIKDVLAYLKTIDNGDDDLSVQRIINVPRRGIGPTSVAKVSGYAIENGMSFYAALLEASEIKVLGHAAAKFTPFVEFIEGLKKKKDDMTVPELIREVLDATGYLEELKAEGTDEALARIENIEELINKAVTYQEEASTPSLSGFLEEVALIADIDAMDENEDYVVLMTLHSAKGLEFPNVYMAGMEDGLFPSYMSITADDEDEEMEEERRLCYVGITRAKKRLTMTSAKARLVRGEWQYAAVSRFVKELPTEILDGSIWEERRGGFDALSDEAEERPSFKERKKQLTSPTAVAEYAKKLEAAKTSGTKIQKNELDYGIGDRVSHQKFGEGVVTNIADGGRDYEVTVDFDRVGVKKMFASFARMEKV